MADAIPHLSFLLGCMLSSLTIHVTAKAMYAWKKLLVRKGVLLRTRPLWFQWVQAAGVPPGSKLRVQLPNFVSVSCSGEWDAGALGHDTDIL